MKIFRRLCGAIYSLFSQPYLSVKFSLIPGREQAFDVVANRVAIRRIDQYFKDAHRDLDASMSKEEKVQVFLDELDSRERTRIVFERLGRPYMRVRMDYRPDGEMGIDAVYNRHVIYDIDQRYRSFGRDDYDFSAGEMEKVAMFVADMTASVVPGYTEERVPIGQVPAEAFEDALSALDGRVPALRDSPVRQIVDVNDLDRYGAMQ